jgi:hypothetical protein
MGVAVLYREIRHRWYNEVVPSYYRHLYSIRLEWLLEGFLRLTFQVGMGIGAIGKGTGLSVEGKSAVESREESMSLDLEGHGATACNPCIVWVITAIVVVVICYHIIF